MRFFTLFKAHIKAFDQSKLTQSACASYERNHGAVNHSYHENPDKFRGKPSKDEVLRNLHLFEISFAHGFFGNKVLNDEPVQHGP